MIVLAFQKSLTISNVFSFKNNSALILLEYAGRYLKAELITLCQNSSVGGEQKTV